LEPKSILEPPQSGILGGPVLVPAAPLLKPLYAENVDTWNIPRSSTTHAELLVPHAKVRAWKLASAPIAMLQDLVWGIAVRMSSHVPVVSRPNYFCRDRQVHIDDGMNLLLNESKIELVTATEISDTVVSLLGVVPKPHSAK
jgi:hypothetical protein